MSENRGFLKKPAARECELLPQRQSAESQANSATLDSGDSKICDEKAELRSFERGDKAGRLSHKRKTSSLLYRAKLNRTII